MGKTINEKIDELIEELRQSDVKGCVTGSCLTGRDFSAWSSVPDVDLFAYSSQEMLHAIMYAQYRLGFELGADDTELSAAQERQKMEWMMQGKRNKGANFRNLQTVKLHRDGLTLNISHKDSQSNMADVICAFDMSIIMKAIDLPSGAMLDLTTQWSDSDTAVPNPMRSVDLDVVTVAYWVRQFDRVVKYWQRQFDTRPMARFYIEQIDAVMAKGKLWSSEKADAFYDEYFAEFAETREKIQKWLNEVGDC